MKDIIVDKNEDEYKNGMSITRMCIFVFGIGSVLLYIILDAWYYSILNVVFAVLLYLHSIKIKTMFSFYLNLSLTVLYFVFLSFVYQFYYFNTYMESFSLLILFYLLMFFLMALDYFSLKKKGAFEQLFEALDYGVVEVVDVFGMRTRYFKIKRLQEKRTKPKLMEGNILFALIIMPILLLAIILAPFVKSIPVIVGFYVTKNHPDADLSIMLVCTLILNMMIFKYCHGTYGWILYYLRK